MKIRQLFVYAGYLYTIADNGIMGLRMSTRDQEVGEPRSPPPETAFGGNNSYFTIRIQFA